MKLKQHNRPQQIGKWVMLFIVTCCHSYLTAQCDLTINEFPYSESFETVTNDWSPISDQQLCGIWTRIGETGIADGSLTPTKRTGPNLAAEGTYAIYTEASGCKNSSFYLTSPCFDFADKVDAGFQFSYFMFGKKIESLALQVSLDNGNSWVGIWSLVGQQQLSGSDPWLTSNISLSLYDGKVIQLRFHGITGDGDESDIAIDDFQVYATDAPCKWVVTSDDHIYFNCENVGIGTESPEEKLDVRGSAVIGTTETPAFLELKSSIDPEIQFTTPTSNSAMRMGVSSSDNTISGAKEGDLYIKNTGEGDNMPLIVTRSGNISLANQSGGVAIGATDPGTYKLAVEGTIGARKIRVTTDSWADYVFEKGYELLPLTKLESYIQRHGHLPNIPSDELVLKEGIDIGAMNVIMLEKIEELTLYIIEQEKRLKSLENQVLKNKNK